LYTNDALGIYDEALINEVGFRLKARCQSFIVAVEASWGQASCPHCERKIAHNHDKTALLVCEACNWEVSWGDYFATFQHHQLSGAQPVVELFSNFITAFPKAPNLREKVFLIDRLIHGFHIYFKDNLTTRPVAVNLIEGRLSDVIQFLDELHAEEYSTSGLEDNHKLWDINIQNVLHWGK
jgi:ribosomal protein L37AE/L43A